MATMIPWDWIAGIYTVAAILLFQRRFVRAGNIIGLLAQIPWFVLVIQTQTWGLLPMETLITGIYAVGFWRSRNEPLVPRMWTRLSEYYVHEEEAR